MHVEYLIIGQGISGTFLSNFFENNHINYLVIDESKDFTASKVASGIINPITGRRYVRTWMIEDVMPFAVKAYKNLESELNCNFISQINILDFHASLQMKNAFDERLIQEHEYLSNLNNQTYYTQLFNNKFGIGEINPCWLIDINKLLFEWRKKLNSTNKLMEENFEINKLQILNNKVQYKNIRATKIIFCDGINSINNSWFSKLPFAFNKGEALIVEINNLPRNKIYKNGINIVPWKENLFWIGSSYEWNFFDEKRTEIFKNKTEFTLKNWCKLEYKIIDHIASIRPANIERRPFVGFHPLESKIGILNGMGTKGCSLAPYFANELVDSILKNKKINAEADINRFPKLLLK